MRILGLVPARGGSKRLPRKNVKPLGGMPLIAWTIRSAIESQCCTDVMVSTDDCEIASVSRQYGAKVPWLRPIELASDNSSSVDVALHALDFYENAYGELDGIILLQPTSPFRKAESIKRAIKLFADFSCRRPVVSMKPALNHPEWCFEINDNSIEPYLGWDKIYQRSQDLPNAWSLDGGMYIIPPNRLRQEGEFLLRDTIPFCIEDKAESIDIDTVEDFDHCASFLTERFVA